MSDIVVVDSGQTYESTESAIVAKNEADRAEQWAKYSEEKANLSEQSALEAAQYKDDAKAQADRAQNISDAFDTNAQEKTQEFNQNAQEKTDTFNANAAEKQSQVDASAENARTWAVGTQEERPEGSSRYWAEEAAKSAASVDADMIKRIAYENNETISIDGDKTIILKDNDEIKTLLINANNTTITFDISQLTFPKLWYSVYLKFLPYQRVFSLKLLGMQESAQVIWMNGNIADFSDGKSHWVTLRINSVKDYVLWSDNGTEG